MVATYNASTPSSPTINTGETRWAADELAGLIARVGRDSVAGQILRQAERELRSLVPATPGKVVGSLRIHVAA